LSKNQLKKLRKKQEWEAKAPERKARRKEQKHRKKERDRAAREAGEQSKESDRSKKPPGQQVPITCIVDCNFDSLMTENEIVSLAGQLTRCYSENKNARFRAHLAVSSFNGRLKERFDTVLSKNYKSWRGFRTFDDDFVQVAERARTWMQVKDLENLRSALSKPAEADATNDTSKEQAEVVYLSSDSDVTLTELKAGVTYVIGGLVDRNRHKGICHKHAMDRNVKTAKLPIGEYIKMSSRQVLTTNHVLEIMLRWLESGDWAKAFMEVIPKRKGGVLLPEDDDAADGQGDGING
ncbi:hypothetical protein NA57DRAFT_23558, partial [Rhizodiscina lignyota]